MKPLLLRPFSSQFDARFLPGCLLPLLISVAQANPYYECRVLAKKGDVGLTNIEQWVSINDKGVVAFVAQAESGPGIYVGDGSAPPRDITDGAGKRGNRFGPAVQINNSNRVVSDNTYLTLSIPPVIDCFPFIGCITFSEGQPSKLLGFARIWNAEGTGSSLIVGQADSTAILGTSDLPYAVLPFPSINNRGEVAYLAAYSSGYRLSTPGWSTTLPRAGYRAMIADSGTVILRTGNERNSPIRLYGPTANRVQDVASSAVGFTELGRSPGITDDGKAVAFAGNRGRGPGIFARLLEDSGIGPVIRIAGEQEGQTGLYPDGGRDKDGALFFADFDLDSRVGVVRLEAGRSGLDDDELIFCFVAVPNRAKASPPNASPIWTAQKGL